MSGDSRKNEFNWSSIAITKGVKGPRPPGRKSAHESSERERERAARESSESSEREREREERREREMQAVAAGIRIAVPAEYQLTPPVRHLRVPLRALQNPSRIYLPLRGFFEWGCRAFVRE